MPRRWDSSPRGVTRDLRSSRAWTLPRHGRGQRHSRLVLRRGKWLDADTAVQHGLDLVAEGADLVDVGGESTRPGALRIDAEEELRRVIPVVAGLVGEGITVSVDTMRAGRRASTRSTPVPRSSTTSRGAGRPRA